MRALTFSDAECICQPIFLYCCGLTLTIPHFISQVNAHFQNAEGKKIKWNCRYCHNRTCSIWKPTVVHWWLTLYFFRHQVSSLTQCDCVNDYLVTLCLLNSFFASFQFFSVHFETSTWRTNEGTVPKITRSFVKVSLQTKLSLLKLK